MVQSFPSSLLALWSQLSLKYTALNTEISPHFLVSKFCGNTQLPQSFGRITRSIAKIVRFNKTSILWNLVKISHFTLWWCLHQYKLAFYWWKLWKNNYRLSLLSKLTCFHIEWIISRDKRYHSPVSLKIQCIKHNYPKFYKSSINNVFPSRFFNKYENNMSQFAHIY